MAALSREQPLNIANLVDSVFQTIGLVQLALIDVPWILYQIQWTNGRTNERTGGQTDRQMKCEEKKIPTFVVVVVAVAFGSDVLNRKKARANLMLIT